MENNSDVVNIISLADLKSVIVDMLEKQDKYFEARMTEHEKGTPHISSKEYFDWTNAEILVRKLVGLGEGHPHIFDRDDAEILVRKLTGLDTLSKDELLTKAMDELGFYSDGLSYIGISSDAGLPSEIQRDYGARARVALKILEEHGVKATWQLREQRK